MRGNDKVQELKGWVGGVGELSIINKKVIYMCSLLFDSNSIYLGFNLNKIQNLSCILI